LRFLRKKNGVKNRKKKNENRGAKENFILLTLAKRIIYFRGVVGGRVIFWGNTNGNGIHQVVLHCWPCGPCIRLCLLENKVSPGKTFCWVQERKKHGIFRNLVARTP
jgi:hypothetical protein